MMLQSFVVMTIHEGVRTDFVFVCLFEVFTGQVSLVEKSKTECCKRFEATKSLERRSTFHTSQMRSPKSKKTMQTTQGK